jgi:site-specific DNA recombinase
MTTKAAIYLRISLDRTGEELGVDRQREDCIQIAEARGWQVVETFVDNSVSASKRTVRRPAYERMVADFKDGRFQALVCWDLDRLTRQPRQLEDWIDAAEGRGLKLVTANGEADLQTESGRMFARVKAAVARSEVEQKAKRQTRAARQRADHGKPPAGSRLTGYTLSSKVIPAEAAIVVGLFERFVAGESIVGLVRMLTAANTPTRSGKPWTRTTVASMLRNPRYAGRAVYQGQPTGKPGNWPPIVQDGLFDLVQARLNDPARKTNRVGTDRKHLGSSLYRCGECGGVVHVSGPCYLCRDCRLLRTREPIDALVLAVIRARLAQPDLAAMLTPSTDSRVAELDAKAKDLRNRLAVVEGDYDAGLIDGRRLNAASERITGELHTVDGERVTLLAGSAAGGILSAHDPVTAFDGASLGGKRAVIAALVTVQIARARRGRAVFDPETVNIEWKHAAENLSN